MAFTNGSSWKKKTSSPTTLQQLWLHFEGEQMSSEVYVEKIPRDFNNFKSRGFVKTTKYVGGPMAQIQKKVYSCQLT